MAERDAPPAFTLNPGSSVSPHRFLESFVPVLELRVNASIITSIGRSFNKAPGTPATLLLTWVKFLQCSQPDVVETPLH